MVVGSRVARWPDAIRMLLASELFVNKSDDGSASARALKYRHLVHLVLDEPLALQVVRALKSMVPELSNGDQVSSLRQRCLPGLPCLLRLPRPVRCRS